MKCARHTNHWCFENSQEGRSNFFGEVIVKLNTLFSRHDSFSGDSPYASPTIDVDSPGCTRKFNLSAQGSRVISGHEAFLTSTSGSGVSGGEGASAVAAVNSVFQRVAPSGHC